ncbi:MAG: hypothetical protein ACTSW7_01505 [Candidatus Thorarchaeota archaeon]|nr:hypothetical protein [Thermoplasmatales archaeon]
MLDQAITEALRMVAYGSTKDDVVDFIEHSVPTTREEAEREAAKIFADENASHIYRSKFKIGKHVKVPTLGEITALIYGIRFTDMKVSYDLEYKFGELSTVIRDVDAVLVEPMPIDDLPPMGG